jgi:F-type H+-transporting ATPase subunit gamma
MDTLKKVKEDLETVNLISTITSVYCEIAKMRMNQIRGWVLKNREFLQEIAKIYQKTKLAYFSFLKKGKILKEGKDLEKITFLKKIPKTAIIFLSANQPFYGKLIYEIWSVLSDFLEAKGIELIVVGKIGRDLVLRFDPSKKFSFFELDDDKPKKEEVEKIVEFAKRFQRVIVFHGKFESPIKQSAAASEISGIFPTLEKIEKAKEYLFEPSPEEIFEFFETEIFTRLFHQTIFEHQLAKFAARVIAMYEATEKSKKEKEKLQMKKIKIQKDIMNKKQINLFLGHSLWSGT